MDTATIAEVGGYALLALALIGLVKPAEKLERRIVAALIGTSPDQLVRNTRGVLEEAHR